MDRKPKILFDMDEKMTKDSILSQIKSPQIVSSTFQVNPAIEMITDDMLRLGTDYRKSVPKTLVILTNQPQDVSAEPEIKDLLEKGIKVVAIGIGNKISPSDLLMLTGGKPSLIQVVNKEGDIDEDKIKEFLNPGNFYFTYLS